MEIHLPADVLQEIFSYLDAFSLLQAAQVNKSWSESADRGFLWRRLCLRKWCLGDVTREHLCTQMWQHLGTHTWKQFFLCQTKRERCMERAQPEDFIYREIQGDFEFVKYLSGKDFTMDEQGKSILCTVSSNATLSTWDVQKGIMTWRSPVQKNDINKLATLPEMHLAITADMERTIKVWNCRDQDAIATRVMPHDCFILRAFLTKDGPFLLVGDYVGEIHTLTMPELQIISKIKVFQFLIHVLICSPGNNWVFISRMHQNIFPKVYPMQSLLTPSEDTTPLGVSLPFPLCFKACWTPKRRNRITVMYQSTSPECTGFVTFDIGLETISGKEIVTASEIAKFLLPDQTELPLSMGVSDADVIVFGSGPCLFLYTIDGLQLHRIQDQQTSITTLRVDSLHVLSLYEDGSLYVYMWEEGGRLLKSCCQMEHMRKSLPTCCYVYKTACDNVSIVRVVSWPQNVDSLEMYTLNMCTLKK